MSDKIKAAIAGLRSATHYSKSGCISIKTDIALLILSALEQKQAATAQAEQRITNELCAILINNGFATGHADSVSDALQHLDEQLRESRVKAEQRIMELEQKCAEQQDQLVTVARQVYTSYCYEYISPKTCEYLDKAGNFKQGKYLGSTEELTILLEEAKRVPEDWVKAYKDFMRDYCRYADGDSKMPFSELRFSMAVLIEESEAMLEAAKKGGA